MKYVLSERILLLIDVHVLLVQYSCTFYKDVIIEQRTIVFEIENGIRIFYYNEL